MKGKARRRDRESTELGPRDWTFETAARVERARRPRPLRPRASRKRAVRMGPVASRSYAEVARPHVWRGPLVLPSRSQVRALAPRLWGLLAVAFWTWLALWVSLSDAYYVSRVEVLGHEFLPMDRLVGQAGVPEGYHIFFVNPAAVRARLLALPGVRDAEVRCTLPGRITVRVVERKPVLQWRVGAEQFWADEEGVLFPATGALEGAVAVVEVDRAARQPGDRVEPDLVRGVRELAALLPEVAEFEYSQAHGLAFRMADGTRVFLGTEELPYRVQVLQRLLAELKVRGSSASEVHLEYRYPVVRP
ncbi:MAG: cell division protein FtsQ/DivIB [Anaerolineae bacterium]